MSSFVDTLQRTAVGGMGSLAKRKKKNDTANEEVVEAEVVDTATPEETGEAAAKETVAASDPADEVTAEAAEEPMSVDVEETVEAETAPDPQIEEAPLAPAKEPSSQGVGVIPLVFGGLIAGGLGYMASTFSEPEIDLTSQLAPVEAQAEAASAAASDAAAQAQSAIDELAGIDLAPLSTSLDTIQASIDALAARVDALEARPVGDSGVTEGDLAALGTTLAEQQQASEALAAELARLADMQAAGLANAETEALEAARAAKDAAARQLIQSAFVSGEPFAVALPDLATPAPDALAAVAQTGVPQVEALTEPFADLSRAALDIHRTNVESEGSAADRVGAFLSRQLNTRSVAPREGDDPDAILSRAGAAMASADIATALSELEALPEDVQAPFSDWLTQARQRAAAEAALRDYLSAN